MTLQAIAPAQKARETVQVPTLSELDAARLDRAVLRIEVLQLHLQARQAEATALVQSLERDGFSLHRLPDGTWAYQPTPVKGDP